MAASSSVGNSGECEDGSNADKLQDMGRCIYGGIYDPDNPLSDDKGHRKDVKEALIDLDIPVIRYPGGNCE